MSSVLHKGGVTLPGLEADRIICFELGMSRASVMSRPGAGVAAADCERLITLAGRRASGEPLAYVLNDALFCERSFFVDSRVLIPRPETEIMTDIADGLLRETPNGVFADWCAGSGCIAVTLLARNPGCSAYAIDISAEALEVAAINVRRHSVEERLSFICRGDPAGVCEIAPSSLDMVVSNPPYISSRVIKTLGADIRDYEPWTALDGGADGLDVFRLLLRGLPRLMKPGAAFLCETGGAEQIDAIIQIAENISPDLSFYDVFSDHRKIMRYIMWRKTAYI